jgi:hypothetical protein
MEIWFTYYVIHSFEVDNLMTFNISQRCAITNIILEHFNDPKKKPHIHYQIFLIPLISSKVFSQSLNNQYSIFCLDLPVLDSLYKSAHNVFSSDFFHLA